MASINPLDYWAIRNTIAEYCVALDTKNFDLFDQVFTEDVQAVYPFFTLKSRQETATAIEKRLRPITSQHALSTQKISIAADGQSADATTYFTGIHFGKGKWEGKEVTAWGKYVDHLVLVQGREGDVPGASPGKWLIDRRETIAMGRLGEEGVMEQE